MSQETFIERKEDNIAVHVFSGSAAMVGVCIMVIGILNVISSVTKIETWQGQITSLDAVIFLVTCLLSYIAIKTKDRKRRFLLERISDIGFLTGLTLMVVVCIFIVTKFAIRV